jgi:hypothetical protein
MYYTTDGTPITYANLAHVAGTGGRGFARVRRVSAYKTKVF